MKKLLNNPFVVGGLALTAIGIVAMNLAPLFTDDPLAETGEIVSAAVDSGAFGGGDPLDTSGGLMSVFDRGSDETDGVAEYASGQRRESFIAGTDLGWQQNPTRDPFKPLAESQPIELVIPNIEEFTSEKQQTVTDVNVKAIVIGRSFRIAVVDGSVVSEGKQVGDTRITSVDHSTIGIEGQDGKHRRIEIGEVQ